MAILTLKHETDRKVTCTIAIARKARRFVPLAVRLGGTPREAVVGLFSSITSLFSRIVDYNDT